jgi:uncharacterized GH25 family protein
MLQRPLSRILLALLFLLSPGVPAAAAHEFWILPESFRVSVGELLRVSTLHGERLAGAVVPRNDDMVARFELISANSSQPVRGPHGGPVGFVRPSESGSAVLVYESREFSNQLAAESFENYLQTEGLDWVIAQREQAGETSVPGREVYIRCSKALVRVLDGADRSGAAPTDRTVGLPLEIRRCDPTGGDGDSSETTFEVRFKDRPIPGLRVVAAHQGSPGELRAATTDDNGRASFDCTTSGVWLITTIHIERTPDRTDTDWKSYWGSLTFRTSE